MFKQNMRTRGLNTRQITGVIQLGVMFGMMIVLQLPGLHLSASAASYKPVSSDFDLNYTREIGRLRQENIQEGLSSDLPTANRNELASAPAKQNGYLYDFAVNHKTIEPTQGFQLEGGEVVINPTSNDRTAIQLEPTDKTAGLTIQSASLVKAPHPAIESGINEASLYMMFKNAPQPPTSIEQNGIHP